MANTTASTLITRVLDQLSRASVGTTRSGITLETLAISWLNYVMNRIARTHDFREMYKRYTASTVADQKTYAFPDNYKQVLSLVVRDGSNSIKLTHMSSRQFSSYVPYPEDDSTGRPSIYIPEGNEFDLYKIPDDTYTMLIRTVQWPTVITATTDSIDYLTDKDDIIVAGMTSMGFNHLQMYEDAIRWEQEFMGLLQQARLDDGHRPDYDPIAEGFNSQPVESAGEYWTDPFVWRSV